MLGTAVPALGLMVPFAKQAVWTQLLEAALALGCCVSSSAVISRPIISNASSYYSCKIRMASS